MGQSADNNLIGVSETKCHDLDNDLYWAIGFFEGEGTLLVREGRIYISAAQMTNNVKVLYRLKKIFGLGGVQVMKNPRYSVWKVKKIDHKKIRKFINLINGRLITEKKNLELQKAIEFINSRLSKYSGPNEDLFNLIKYLGPNKLSKDNAWLTGFCDGEGCHNVSIRPRSIHIRVIISQKEKQILDLINNLFPGSVWASDNPHSHFKYSGASMETRKAWIEYLTKYPYKGNKKIQYLRWLKCHNIVLQGLHRTKEGLAQIKELI